MGGNGSSRANSLIQSYLSGLASCPSAWLAFGRFQKSGAPTQEDPCYKDPQNRTRPVYGNSQTWSKLRSYGLRSSLSRTLENPDKGSKRRPTQFIKAAYVGCPELLRLSAPARTWGRSGWFDICQIRSKPTAPSKPMLPT